MASEPGRHVGNLVFYGSNPSCISQSSVTTDNGKGVAKYGKL